MTPLLLSSFTTTTCLGNGLAPNLEALHEGRSGLRRCDFDSVDLDTFIGTVEGVDQVRIRQDLQQYDCRNNRLLQLALEQDGFSDAVAAAIKKYGADRIGMFLGTSTAGILQTELAFRHRDPDTGALPADFIYKTTHNTFSASDFAHRYFGLSGPAATISSACSSSAKVFASARRMIEAGIIDAAVVGGVDSLCLTTLYGFSSLGLLSDSACRPFDAHRSGISIGEAAALVLLEKMPDNLDQDAILLLGIGESSDAHHMSSPHPDGLGATLAMQQALASAGIGAHQIDYVNLHGTATPTNDAAEGKAIHALFGSATACSSTKGATGHTLGAAGGVEAILCALALSHGLIPGGVNTTQLDPTLALNYLLSNEERRIDRVLSNSFGFGGTNCSLVFGRANQP